MLRLITVRDLSAVLKCSQFLVTSVRKKHVISFLPVSNACCHRLSTLPHHFHTGNPATIDARLAKSHESEVRETVDLDGWKAVMRSKAAPEEKLQVTHEEEASDEDETITDSTLEATRNLVVMWRQAGKLVPQDMTDEELQALAELTTKSSRKKYLKHLAIKETHKRNRKEKQQQKKADKEALLKQRNSEADEEAPVMKNTFLLQFWSRSLDKLLGWRSAQAMMFGQPLVFDFSYEANMSRREIDNTVSQLLEVEGWNRRATEPFHLYFCNLQPDSYYKQELLKRYGAETWERLFITSTNKQHVELFPVEQLVYLTADSPNVLRTFDHSKVYIIGSMVDRSVQSGLSLANAKRLKLATARLPLDEFLHWEVGAKNLTLDQMIRIMLTLKDTGKWEEALKFVPTRKHDGFHQQQEQKRTKNTAGIVTAPGARQNLNRLKTSESNGVTTVKRGTQALTKSHKESEFSGRGKRVFPLSDKEIKPPGGRVRTSLRSSIEGKRITSKNKVWWDE